EHGRIGPSKLRRIREPPVQRGQRTVSFGHLANIDQGADEVPGREGGRGIQLDIVTEQRLGTRELPAALEIEREVVVGTGRVREPPDELFFGANEEAAVA